MIISRPLIKCTPWYLLGVVAVAFLAGGTLAQSPATVPTELQRQAPAQAGAGLPGVATEGCLGASTCDGPCSPVHPLFCDPLLEQPKPSSDGLGLCSSLPDCGITANISTTQFYQGVASGGLERSFPYGGRNDYFLHVDGQKLGLWKGFLLDLHGETRYGESTNFITGALSPVNEMLLVPADEGCITALTGVKFTQHLSDNILVYAGKINLFDGIRQPLTGATPLNGFLNTSLIFNTIFARTLPYSAFGAGFVLLQDKEPIFSLSVYDTNNTPTTTGFEHFFDNGATIFGVVNLPTSFFGLPGHQGLSGAYSSGKYTNLAPSPYLDPVDELVFPSPPKTGSWALAYNFDQALRVSQEDPERVWGVFGNLGIADDNPNPLQWYASAGIGGASLLRKKDTFGLGFYYLGISDKLKQSARPLSPLRNENGVELYYNARVSKWFQITPDLQIIDPFQKEANPAVVLGLRAKIDF